MSKNDGTNFNKKDRRRRHAHWLATIIYNDKQEFSRVYLDIEKAKKFVKRQKKSPVVSGARIQQLK
jgi:hypothetical protein